MAASPLAATLAAALALTQAAGGRDMSQAPVFMRHGASDMSSRPLSAGPLALAPPPAASSSPAPPARGLLLAAHSAPIPAPVPATSSAPSSAPAPASSSTPVPAPVPAASSAPSPEPVPAASPASAPASEVPAGNPLPPFAPTPAIDLAPPESPGAVRAPVPQDSLAATRSEGPAPAPAAEGLCHGSTPCRRLITLGSVAGGLGLGALVTGVALLARPVAVDPDDPTSLVTYRPAGAALLAVGAGLAATWLLTLLAARKAGRLAQRLRAAAPAP